MIKVEQIVNEIFASNTYVISKLESDNYWLVDIGDYLRVSTYLPINAKVKGIFITHTHFDHIYGINQLLLDYPECLIYTSHYGAEALRSAKKNFSLYHQSPIEYNGDNIIILEEKDSIELYDGYRMNVFETPGHCPSCLTYIFGQYCFTGDSYIPNVPIVSKLPRGNKNIAQESKNKILLLSKNKIICAGHGPVFYYNKL